MLSSCRLSVPIEVQQLDDGRIAIATKGGDPAPCIKSIVIVEAPREGYVRSDAKKLWDLHIYPDVNSNIACKSRILYPDFPKNYYLESVPVRLEAGHKYRIMVDGPGYGSGTDFVPTKVP